MARRRPEPPLDPFERAARRSDPEYAQLAEAADAVPPRHLRATRLLLLFGVVIAAAAVAKGGGGDSSVARSCSSPGFALARTSYPVGGQVRWSATGPVQDRVVLALDTAAPPATPLVSATALKDCLAEGTFRLQADKGEHEVVAFFLGPDGDVLARQTKTITIQ